MSNTWNDCRLIYKNGELEADLGGAEFAAFTKYCHVLQAMPEERVWYDSNSDMCFGSEQTFFVKPDDFSFFNTRDKFINSPYWGFKHVEEVLGNHLGNDKVVSDEYIIQNNNLLDKCRNKNVLIVGAGPSAVDVEWENMDLGYDYLWSCNNFYKNEKLTNKRVDLTCLGPTVDLESPSMLEKVKSDKTTCVFEGGVSPFRTPQELLSFKETNPENTTYFHLRYFSKLGVVARMVCMATLLGAKNVYMVGFDGDPVGKKHAFEGEEKVHDEVWRNSQTSLLYKRQMVLLWDYLLNLKGSQTRFHNLGEGHEHNQLTDISEKEFPLNLT